MNKCTKCPELIESLDWAIYFCKAGNRPYIPDHDKLSTDCKSGEYITCHYYLRQGKYAIKAKEYADMPPSSGNIINPPASKNIFTN